MTLTSADVDRLLARTPPGAVKLARYASIAARIEPELLRRIRVDVLPQLTAADEADLWLSSLPAARSALWMSLQPEVAQRLREQLRDELREELRKELRDGSRRETHERVERAVAAIAASHVAAPPPIVLEDDVLALMIRGDDLSAAEERLVAAAEAIRDGTQPGLAHWAVRALGNLPEELRTSRAGWILNVVAHNALKLPLAIRQTDAGGTIPPDVWALLDTETEEVWVSLTARGILFSRGHAVPGGTKIDLPRTEPMIVRLQSDNNVVKDVAIGQTPRGIVLKAPVTITAVDGRQYVVEEPGIETPKPAEFRFLLLSGLRLARHAAEWEGMIKAASSRRFDAVFVAGDIAEHGASEEYERVTKPLRMVTQSTPIFIVPGNHDAQRDRLQRLPLSDTSRLFSGHLTEELGEAFRPFLRFTQNFGQKTRGALPGDQSATLKIAGRRIGVIALNTSITLEERGELRDRQLAAAIDGDLREWFDRHEFTILLTHHGPDLLDEDALVTLDDLRKHCRGALLHLYGNGHDPTTPVWRMMDVWTIGNVSFPDYAEIEGRFASGYVDLLVNAPARPSAEAQPAQVRVPTVHAGAKSPDTFVLIAGTGTTLDKLETSVSRELGRVLAERGFGVITGGWPGVDSTVATSYAQHIEARYPGATGLFLRHIAGKVYQRGIPGSVVHLDSDDDAVAMAVKNSSAVIVVGGRGGARDVAETARGQRMLVVPIPVTGGDAATLYQQYRWSYAQLPPELIQTGFTPEAIATAAVDFIERSSLTAGK